MQSRHTSFTSGFEKQFVAGSSSGSGSNSRGGASLINSLGKGKLSKQQMSKLRNVLAEQTSHGHQKQNVNIRKAAGRNVITPPWGAAAKKEKQHQRKVVYGKFGPGAQPYQGYCQLDYLKKKKSAHASKAEVQDMKDRQAAVPQMSRPSYYSDNKSSLQNDYKTNLRTVSTVPNSLLSDDIGNSADTTNLKRQYESDGDQIFFVDPLPKSEAQVRTEHAAASHMSANMNEARPYR
jgi:hypothetical protein